MAAGRHFENR